MADTQHFDVAIIGGGSGLTAASHAVDDGKNVALIDAKPNALGGTCINRGCIPTKGLVQAANVMRAIRTSDRFAVALDQSSVRCDFAKVMRTVRERRDEQSSGVRSWVEDAMTPFFGRARFTDDKLIEMDDGRRVSADTFFLATGAKPAAPPIDGLHDVDYLTNESALELDEQPGSLIIVGGGYIGCKFAHFFSALGTDVTIVHPDPDRLLSEDDDIGDVFTDAFGERVELVLGGRATGVERSGNGVRVTVETDRGERTLEAEALMLAAGRSPNTGDLGLKTTGVDTDEKGWIRADDAFRTSNADVYAYGDCIGRAMFKHTSSYEGGIAYRNSQGGDERASYRANPHAVFAEPEIASVGLTERDCQEQGLRYDAKAVEYANIAKGEILGSPVGLAKALVHEDTREILGFHLAGPNAAMLIQEVVVAMSLGAKADAITEAIHIHPSMPELVKKVFSRV